MSHMEQVVWPLGPARVPSVDLDGVRLDDLNGKVVAELQNMEFGDYFPTLRSALKERFPDVTILDYEQFGLTHGPYEEQVIAELPARLKEKGVDLAISAMGV